MKTALSLVVLAFLVLVRAGSARTGPQAGERQSGFSRPATALGCSPNAGATSETYRSPDGRKALIASGLPNGDPRVEVKFNGSRTRVPYPHWSCPEALWSPDSSAFFLNYSTGGLVGNFEVRVYYPSPEGLGAFDPSVAAKKDFLAHYPKCFNPEAPNLAGVAWLTASRILVAAEVLPHSNCDAMGTFATYEVDLPSGTIARKHGQLESKQRFARLIGPELRNADDECIRHPSSCWIAALHKK